MITLKYQEQNTINSFVIDLLWNYYVDFIYLLFSILLYYFSSNYNFTDNLEDLLGIIIEYKHSTKYLNENVIKWV